MKADRSYRPPFLFICWLRDDFHPPTPQPVVMDKYSNNCDDHVNNSDDLRQDQHSPEQMVKNLTYLIRVYDAADSLYHFSHQLTGHTLSPHSIVSELLLVTDVINHMSSLYDPEIKWEENPVRKVLDQKELSAKERAERLV